MDEFFFVQGNEPESFHQFYSDEDTMLQFGRLTQIFTALKNYTKVAFTFNSCLVPFSSKAAVKENTVDHTPVMRPLFLMFENDTQSYYQVLSFHL